MGEEKESQKEKGGNGDEWWGGDSWGQQQNCKGSSDSWGYGDGGRRGPGNWQEERNASWGGRWADDDSVGWNRKRRRGGGQVGGGRGQQSAAKGCLPSEEEQAKRATRSLRFRTHDVTAEDAPTGEEAKEEIPAR